MLEQHCSVVAALNALRGFMFYLSLCILGLLVLIVLQADSIWVVKHNLRALEANVKRSFDTVNRDADYNYALHADHVKRINALVKRVTKP